MNNIKATQIVTLLHKLLCVWSAINAHNLTPVKHDNQNMAQVSVQHPLSNKIVSITGMTWVCFNMVYSVLWLITLA